MPEINSSEHSTVSAFLYIYLLPKLVILIEPDRLGARPSICNSRGFNIFTDNCNLKLNPFKWLKCSITLVHYFPWGEINSSYESYFQSWVYQKSESQFEPQPLKTFPYSAVLANHCGCFISRLKVHTVLIPMFSNLVTSGFLKFYLTASV